VRPTIAAILSGLERGADGVFSSHFVPATAQADEVREREAVARTASGDLLGEVGRHHSIAVMDREVRRFLHSVPEYGVVLDAGGGWGWQWRHLGAHRPDVGVVILDFVRDNLRQAARLLGGSVDDQVALVHADATQLPFGDAMFAGYWSVQTLQHIPDFDRAVGEARRVLRPNAPFACYSLNHQTLVEAMYRALGRRYHVRGPRQGSSYLSRATAREAANVERVFGAAVTCRYTEVLFHPDLGMQAGGERSWIGRLDTALSSDRAVLSWIARQRSYHTRKQASPKDAS
jgi:ubiquinone/menaquinone biosynthesis C-methylase UbiE